MPLRRTLEQPRHARCLRHGAPRTLSARDPRRSRFNETARGLRPDSCCFRRLADAERTSGRSTCAVARDPSTFVHPAARRRMGGRETFGGPASARRNRARRIQLRNQPRIRTSCASASEIRRRSRSIPDCFADRATCERLSARYSTGAPAPARSRPPTTSVPLRDAARLPAPSPRAQSSRGADHRRSASATSG
jgi:hypothetical protein